jgi:hypothetical protein
MAHDPSNVADYFQGNARDHGDCECGCAAGDRISDDEAEQRNAEKREKGGIGGEGDTVKVVGGIEGASEGGRRAVDVFVAVGGMGGTDCQIGCGIEKGGHVDVTGERARKERYEELLGDQDQRLARYSSRAQCQEKEWKNGKRQRFRRRMQTE